MLKLSITKKALSLGASIVLLFTFTLNSNAALPPSDTQNQLNEAMPSSAEDLLESIDSLEPQMLKALFA